MDFDIKGYIKYWEALNDAVLLAASSPLCANIFSKVQTWVDIVPKSIFSHFPYIQIPIFHQFACA